MEQINIPKPNDVLSQDEGIHLVVNRIQGLLKRIVLEILKLQNQLKLIRNRIFNRYTAFSWLTNYPNTIPIPNYLGIIHRNRFESKAKGRKPGVENKNSHYRKGVAGDWRHHFNNEIKEKFKYLYGNLLIKLGYENDFNW